MFFKNKITYHEIYEIGKILEPYINKNTSKMIVSLKFKGNKCIIYSNNPGYLIGKGGQTIDKITEEIKKITHNKIKKILIRQLDYIISNCNIL